MEMLNLGIWGLSAAYMAVAFILLSLHIHSKWRFSVKFIASILVFVLCAVTYKSYPGLLGWPVKSSVLPSRLFLVAVEVQEPDAVYLWAKDLDSGLADRKPRAYQLSYSKLLHEQAARAAARVRRGVSVIVEVDAAVGAVPNTATGLNNVSQPQRVKFVDAPEGLLPDKE